MQRGAAASTAIRVYAAISAARRSCVPRRTASAAACWTTPGPAQASQSASDAAWPPGVSAGPACWCATAWSWRMCRGRWLLARGCARTAMRMTTQMRAGSATAASV
eukprot:jgi/Astpho2/6971/e_gw1.00107.162.1_t